MTLLNGITSLDKAYEEARAASGTGDEARLRALSKACADLADKVRDDEMTLAFLEQQAKDQAEAAKTRRWATTKTIIEGLRGLTGDVAFAAETAADIDHHYAQEFHEPITPQRLREAAAYASALADAMERKPR